MRRYHGELAEIKKAILKISILNGRLFLAQLAYHAHYVVCLHSKESRDHLKLAQELIQKDA
jgi:hypothetical protein